MDSLPRIPGYNWRIIEIRDAEFLYQFELDCSDFDGATHIIPAAEWEQRLRDSKYSDKNSIVAANKMGQIAAAGWISYQEEADEVQAFLDGRVHPNYRGGGIGGKLLTWLEDRALKNLSDIANGRNMVLRIMFYDRGKDAITLYENHGYRFQYAEEVLEFDLRKKPPVYPNPVGMTFQTWSPEKANAFYQSYLNSFSTRTKTLLDKNVWSHHFANPQDDEFHPGLSLLAIKNNQSLAFAVCHTDELLEDEQNNIIWITQMGVHNAWRRQGNGAALLSELLRRFILAGFRFARLSVNVNNPSARSLYDKVGFTPNNRFTLYRREIEL